MNTKEIKELLELMSEHKLAEIEIEKGDVKVKLKKMSDGRISVESGLPQTVVSLPPSISMQNPAAPVSAAVEGSPSEDLGVTIIKSPMVGTFYSAPAPDQPPYATVGQTVSEGSVLCIIEAMKLMNEIKADLGGTITEILVKNGQTVEYDQPIMKIKKG